nr:hypothetical protein [Nocardia sp. SYP-A9097]
MCATKKLIPDLWLIEASAADEEAAMADRILFGSPPDREKTDAVLVSLRPLIDQALSNFGQRGSGATLVLTQQLEIAGCILGTAQPQRQSLCLNRERHRLVQARHLTHPCSVHAARPDETEQPALKMA